jgi:hypothetical protein
MRRATAILLWGVVFLVLAYLLMAIPFSILFLHEGSDPPTELLLMGVTLFCPLAGITGIILGFFRKLPGTK